MLSEHGGAARWQAPQLAGPPSRRYSAREVRYPGEVAIPKGHAGQTKDAVVLCHQVRTIDLQRVSAFQLAGKVQYLTDAGLRRQVRAALARHLGLDMPGSSDGAV